MNGPYAERPRAWPVATRLYLPPEWAADAARRQQAQVPETVNFKPKAEIAWALLAEAQRCGVVYAGVTCEADYGDHPSLSRTAPRDSNSDTVEVGPAGSREG